mmetsp:Transcript_25963/g.103809  ORF Transcript_25963/g.103809 Transcript_25963/m.103809 type:complete len:612 (-) Transcript_25963:992-2827(-)
MASLVLKEHADFLVHDSFTVETADHEDHTFNGVMFDLHIKTRRPVAAVVVDSIYVRGGLGRMTVWCSRGGYADKRLDGDKWELCYAAKIKPSWHELHRLALTTPLVAMPGETYGVYVHSADDGDDGVVYDNQRGGDAVYEDDFITLTAGVAHLASQPFSDEGPWWGSPWRQRRQFVGKVSYGARYKLWAPHSHACFSTPFQRGAAAAFAALAMGWRGLPVDCVLYVLNACRFDWFDTAADRDDADDDDDDDAASRSATTTDAAGSASATPRRASSSTATTMSAQCRRTWYQRLRQRVSTDYSRFDRIDDDTDDDETVAAGADERTAKDPSSITNESAPKTTEALSNHAETSKKKNSPLPKKRGPFTTQLSWQNTDSDCQVFVLLPDDVTPNGVRAKFAETRTVIDFGHLGALQTVTLPHPPTEPSAARWTLRRRRFPAAGDDEKPCVEVTLTKKTRALWPRDTFSAPGSSTSPPRDERLAAGTPRDASPTTTPPGTPPPPPPGGFQCTYTWAQDDERISIWLTAPDGITSKHVKVDSKPLALAVTVTNPDGETGVFERDMIAPVRPDETIWEFDDDRTKHPDNRRLRIDLVTRTLEDWDALKGPFRQQLPP